MPNLMLRLLPATLLFLALALLSAVPAGAEPVASGQVGAVCFALLPDGDGAPIYQCDDATSTDPSIMVANMVSGGKLCFYLQPDDPQDPVVVAFC